MPSPSKYLASDDDFLHENLIRSEILSPERLEQFAENLAAEHVHVVIGGKGAPLGKRLLDNDQKLRETYRLISDAIQDSIEMPPAAEWLVDNYFVLEEQIREIRNDMPPGYYRRLPKFSYGPQKGYPRIYAVALAFTAHTDSFFSPALLEQFIRAYQRRQLLDICELWAVSIALRMTLVENLRRTALLVINDRIARADADIFVNQLLELVENDPKGVEKGLRLINKAPVTASFVVQLIRRLRDQDARVIPFLERLEERLEKHSESVEGIVHNEHQNQGALTVTVRNIITSMRLISNFDWVEFFEKVSLVDDALRAGSSFGAMDLPTRNIYRRAIENLAFRSNVSELNIVRHVLRLSEDAKNAATADQRDIRKADPGYYLIDKGRPALEKLIGFRPTWRQRLRIERPVVTFILYILANVALVTCIIEVGLAETVHRQNSFATLLILSAAAFFPAWEGVITLVNRFVFMVRAPTLLPGMALREGIPEEFRTMVVVPVLLGSEGEVKSLANQLLIHYLSNPDEELRFALLSDYRDADHENMPNDEALLQLARARIATLNNRYPRADGASRFYILHRRRQWNEKQSQWMGWERKRGKLHEFNLLLRGATDTSFVMDQEQGPLPDNVRFIVTLDADTRLPRGSVRRLVGKMSHPLNRACFDPAAGYVVDGYGILQPRVSSSLPEQNADTLFQRIFYSASGIDPYAFAISDVYQDLFEEGSFTGKGIYDLDMFERAIGPRIPENAVLSHDLVEGIFARAGLASDVEVIEDFPSRYDVACMRQSRWVRGDWQLLPWIFGKHSPEVPPLGYWKMVDNLRRTFTAPFTLLALVLGWTLPLHHGAGLWTVFILAAYTMPLLLPYIEGLIPRRSASKRNHMMAVLLDSWQTARQILCMIMFLPHQAWLMLNAIGRTLWRLYVSHRNLLEWVTAAESKLRGRRTLTGFYRYMAGSLVLADIAAVAVVIFNLTMGRLALPFVLLWLGAPAFAYYSSRPIPSRSLKQLDDTDRKAFRLIGRETWRFFETFVTPTENCLPPDNFQEDPMPVVAHRTSPTNIGLYLLSAISAHDLGWIGVFELMSRFDSCFATLGKMERYRGHFFNWYDTRDLCPLEPRYISSVDSGNLAACLLVVVQTCKSAAGQPLFQRQWLDGCDDTAALLQDAIANLVAPPQSVSLRQLEVHISAMREELAAVHKKPHTLRTVHETLNSLAAHAAAAADLSSTFVAERDGKGGRPDENAAQWAQELNAMLCKNLALMERYAPWMDLIDRNDGLRDHLSDELGQMLTDCMPTLADVAHIARRAAAYLEKHENRSSAGQLLSALEEAERNAVADIAIFSRVAEQAMHLFDDMEFHFLLDPRRKLLSIGYRLTDNEPDNGYYDLMASEARLASIVAIAKGDITESNWFRLGRSVTSIDYRPVLISWSGSMFEYLMPSLMIKEPEDSLLGVTNKMIVRRQISYGNERGVPWGVSESAYNARDLEFTYQYTSFGIPGLGLKRGLSENIVVAPYATVLAAMVEPKAALDNLQRMAAMGAHGDYGWYEAIDFTLKRVPDDAKLAVVKAYMAHHQGMSLIAIQNILLHGRMRERFHSHPLIQATELLLQELPPRNVAVAHPRAEEVHAIAHIREIPPVQPRTYTSPHSVTPRTHLLSNGQYAVMVTTAGSGYSHLRDLAVTRWREDPTRDNWGSYIYLRDLSNGRIWSATYQPVCVEPQNYEVTFHEDRAEFMSGDGDLLTTLNIVICAEDQGEVRRLTLTNRGTDMRDIELTSYAELVLATPAADMAHPAFVKMFIETEFVAKSGVLLATRRARTPEDPPLWVAHIISTAGEVIGDLQYETDRARFIGRGNTLRDPVAMDGRPLTDTAGTVLDPVLSLRCRLRLPAGTTTHVSFWTVVAGSREEALNLADKYRAANAYHRAATIAWTQAQLQYQHLSITPQEAHLFQRLANAVFYADSALRPNAEAIRSGAAAQPVLWSAGVSGDLPIVLLRVDIVSDLKTLRQLVKAHTYWAMKRLEVDLVIINEQPSSYLEDLQREIELMVRTSQAVPRAGTESAKGRIYILRGDQISPAARNLLHATARAVIVGHRGSLAEQLAALSREEIVLPPYRARGFEPKSPAAPFKRPTLEFFNGIGGFAAQGREYVVLLEEGQSTPLPWINVIANPQFGFQVSAEGAGYTWALNSRENKLTPWSNDPVSDEPGEALYLRDLDRNLVWSPVATPIRKPEATYLARHGFGYSSFETTIYDIETTLTHYVPLNDPLKISRLRIRNRSAVVRRLSVTSFTNWLLGPYPNNSAGLVITEMDRASNAMFARNYWSSSYGARTAFVQLEGSDIRVTGDRGEFFGRNGTLAAPAALAQRKPLSGKVGAGLDACSVLQSRIELKPNEEIEITLLLGETADADAARALIAKYKGRQIDDSLHEIKDYWANLVGQVQVETPDRSLDIIMNGWVLYQTVACRIWARSAFYQTSGAYGYRDQLQDVMNIADCRPQWTREHLLRAAGRQFPEGDVQHWWLPSQTDAGQGIRTRFSDDALWLPLVAAHYMRVSGDTGVLDEQVPFLSGPVLPDDKQEAFFLPEISRDTATLYEHCARAIEKSLKTGAHGLGLFGGGDWNDGMNRVGIKGEGESVWLSWFIIAVVRDFAGHAESRNDARVKNWRQTSDALRTALDENAWDGEWYRRGYYDDGTPLGSESSGECRIDSIAQSWAVISGAGDRERQNRAMQAVAKYLIRYEEELALLFTPPFNNTPLDPGYIKGYPPGIRENGGQYTHAALWSAIAYTLLGEGEKAHALFSMLNPINHAHSRAACHRYKVEPYAVAADVYSNPQHIGRGGWTWYTGSSGWMYRAGLDYILGFRLEGDKLRIDPCIPRNWQGYTITYMYKSTRYRIRVDNKSGAGHGVQKIEKDGMAVLSGAVALVDDKAEHEITVVLGSV